MDRTIVPLNISHKAVVDSVWSSQEDGDNILLAVMSGDRENCTFIKADSLADWLLYTSLLVDEPEIGYTADGSSLVAYEPVLKSGKEAPVDEPIAYLKILEPEAREEALEVIGRDGFDGPLTQAKAVEIYNDPSKTASLNWVIEDCKLKSELGRLQNYSSEELSAVAQKIAPMVVLTNDIFMSSLVKAADEPSLDEQMWVLGMDAAEPGAVGKGTFLEGIMSNSFDAFEESPDRKVGQDRAVTVYPDYETALR